MGVTVSGGKRPQDDLATCTALQVARHVPGQMTRSPVIFP